MMDGTYTTAKSDETELLGEEFAKTLNPQDAVFLIGDLGSGKTTFVKGVARGFGITSRILSPTFVILRTHKLPIDKNGIKSLYHLDLYRLKNNKQGLDIGLKEVLEDKAGIVLIEWPDVSQKLVNKKVWKIILKNNKKGGRRINISYG